MALLLAIEGLLEDEGDGPGISAITQPDALQP